VILSPQARFLASIPDALRLVDAIHSDDETLLVETYSTGDLPALLVVLAALVDTDRTLHDMLAWVQRPGVPPSLCDPADWGASKDSSAPHGSHNRYTAGCRGVGCRAAESAYSGARKRTKRDAS
jgi:hypothetical protein